MFAFKSRKVRTVQLRVHQQYSSDSSHNDAASALCFFDCKMDQRLATASTVSYGHPYEFPSAVGSMYYSDNSSDYAVAAPGHGFYNFPQFGQAAYGHPAQWSCDYPATAPSYCSSPPSARASSAYMIYEDNAHRDLHDSGISQGMSPVDEKPHAEYLQLGAPTSHEGIVEDQQMLHQPVQYTGVRVVKKKVTANKKERRRTISINSAFSNLRECIPNVPVDTKLSKIKTLRLATSYIVYLMNLLEDDEDAENGENGKSGASLGCEGFKVDLQRFKRGSKGGLVSAENKLVVSTSFLTSFVLDFALRHWSVSASLNTFLEG